MMGRRVELQSRVTVNSKYIHKVVPKKRRYRKLGQSTSELKVYWTAKVLGGQTMQARMPCRQLWLLPQVESHRGQTRQGGYSG